MEQQKRKNKKVLVLADTTKLGRINLTVRKIGLTIMQNLEYEKAAIFGTNELYDKLVKMIILASGQGFKVRYFTSESEAQRWLLTFS